MFPATISLRTRINLEGTDTEKKLGNVLFDEGVQVLSSFELNQIASLTYNDETCDEIFELIMEVMAHPVDHSVLCVQKSIVVAQHVLIYGAERTVRSTMALKDFVKYLTEFNTVLAAQKQNGMNSWWNSIKGGAVDKGFPVREAAAKLDKLLMSESYIRELRNSKSDPNSLVPVGDDKVAFASDDVRLYMLQKRIEEQNLIRTRSNLAKAAGGFGSGYTSKDGNSVVGAAHSLEEMMKRAEQEKKAFSETGPIYFKPKVKSVEEPRSAAPVPPAVADLLSFGTAASAPTPAAQPKPEVDLLGFGSATNEPPSKPIDPFAPTNPTNDLLGASLPSSTQTHTSGVVDAFNGLSLQPSASTSNQNSDLLGVNSTANAKSIGNSGADVFSGLSLEPVGAALPPNPLESQPPIPTLSASNDHSSIREQPKGNGLMAAPAEDRFAALDALASSTVKTSGSVLAGLEAQNRILSFGGLSSPKLQASLPDHPPPPPNEGPPPVPYEQTDGFGMTMGGMSTSSGISMSSMINGSHGLGGAPIGSMTLEPPPTSMDPKLGIRDEMPSELPPPPPLTAPAFAMPDTTASFSAAEKYGEIDGNGGAPMNDNSEDGFVMGGTAGTGLGDPTAAMPSMPPPPPPM